MPDHGEFDGVSAVVVGGGPLQQERLRLVLRRVGIEVVAGSPSVKQSAKLAEIYGCDLLVASVAEEADPMSVFQVLRRAHKVRPELVSVTVAEGASASMVEAALAAGSFGVVTQPANAEELSSVIRIAMADKRSKSSCSAPRCRLTRREIGILRLVAEGRSNREIAKLLWMSEQTVKFHLANIYKKLGVRNRMEASAWAGRPRDPNDPDDWPPTGAAAAGLPWAFTRTRAFGEPRGAPVMGVSPAADASVRSRLLVGGGQGT